MCKGLAALPQTCLERAKEIKTKLGTLLQKPENSIDLIIPYQEKPEKKPEKLQKPTPEEAAQWRESLDKVLSNSYGLATFKSFLRSEFSEENIEFWEACEDFKKTKSPLKMAIKAKKIYEDFIQTGEHRPLHQRCDSEEPGGSFSLHLRAGSEPDLHPDGERLLRSVPAV
uniref:Regulator of G protein signaling 5a n=1 Tax=Cyprinus carpio carpio TaxID=630221 RepID=A0A9J7WV00_CYPCA